MTVPVTNPRPRRLRWQERLRQGLLLLLALSITGCSASAIDPKTLILYVETGEGGSGTTRVANLEGTRAVGSTINRQFTRLNPGARVSSHYLAGNQMLAEVRYRHDSGLGPDLIITRMRTAQDLFLAGLTADFPVEEEALRAIRPANFEPYERVGKFRGFPIVLQPQVACYNSAKLQQPPQTLNELIALAAGGLKVGFPIRLKDLFWTTSGLRGDTPELILERLKVAYSQDYKPISPPQARALVDWFSWLKTVNLQRNVIFVRSTDELNQMFLRGELDWIPCRGPSLQLLVTKLGKDLGVTPLPGDGSDPAVSVTEVMVISMGRHSSGSQRRLSMEYIQNLLGRFTQRQLIFQRAGLLPVNDRVVIPIKSSAQLAALERSHSYSVNLSPVLPGISRQRSEELDSIIESMIIGTRPVASTVDYITGAMRD